MAIATLPLVARALKDDVAILRKCPWGAMTAEIMTQPLRGERLNNTQQFTFFMVSQGGKMV